MARIVLNDAKVTINSVNLSDHIASVTISTSFDVVETTAFGSAAAKTRVAGLVDNSVTLEFKIKTSQRQTSKRPSTRSALL